MKKVIRKIKKLLKKKKKSKKVINHDMALRFFCR